MYDRSGRWRDAAPESDPQATGRGDRGGLLFEQPPADDSENMMGDDGDSDDGDGYIDLYAPSRGRQWHDVPLSEVKELARRARSHHHALTTRTLDNSSDDVNNDHFVAATAAAV